MLRPKREKQADHLITIVVFSLIVFGLIMISSASAIISYSHFGVNDYYFWHQLGSIFISLIFWSILQRIDYRFWKKMASPILIVTIFLLILVYIPGIGSDYGTAKSWIAIPGPLPTIQPSEFAKLAIIIYLAALFSKKKELTATFNNGFVPFAVIMGGVGGLIALQPDFGTTFIIVVLSASIFFVAGANLGHIMLGMMGALLGVFTIIKNTKYIFNRFTAFLNPDIDPLRTGYHIKQALIAVGSGGWLGHGFGNSRQKFDYLPEAQGDSIFAVIAEELGFIRVSLVILAFIILAVRGYRIAENAPDRFGKLMATGITTWLTFQAFINIAVIISLFPTTGVPLPFISYGGSSLMASVAGIAILLNISKHAYETNTNRRRNWRPRNTRIGSRRISKRKRRR